MVIVFCRPCENMRGTRRSLVAASLLGCLAVVAGVFTECKPATGSIYDFAATDILQTKNISLSQYRNQVVVITNVATYWGLTASHYIGYNALKSKFDGKSFEILAFPCNDFYLVSTIVVLLCFSLKIVYNIF